MRSLLFHHELKAKRLKAIKSKDYRKRMNKVCLRGVGGNIGHSIRVFILSIMIMEMGA